MQDKKIVLTSDHAGALLKNVLNEYLTDKGEYELIVLGPTDDKDSVDYPDMAKMGVEAMQNDIATRGIFICGSGIGMSIAANRYPFIRAALVYQELGAEMARRHNDANVLCLGGRMTDDETAKACVDLFLTTPFEGGRHQCRVEKLGEKK